MWYQAISYLKFLSRSTNRHGVHSPFVYDLVTKCLTAKHSHPEYEKISDYRLVLLEDNTVIEIEDFGAGSRVFKNSKRKVSEIARHVGSSTKENQLLFRICKYFQPENSLELGTSVGLGTISMALAINDGRVISVEGCKNTSAVAENYLEKFGIQTVELHVARFEDFLANSEQKFDLVFIDGNHRKEATLNYFHQLKEASHNDSLLIFDDIYWSKEMTSAWNEIVLDPRATVTIDLFHFGLVFFRREQKKEHFTIRL